MSERGSTRRLKASVRRQFGAATEAYVTSAVHRAGPELEAMLRVARPSGAERVLDAGSGAGHTALTFAPHVAEVVGLDLTPGMVATTLRLASVRDVRNLRAVCADVERMPFPAHCFDLVTTRYSAHHYPRADAALAEVARVLRPGGRLLLADVVAPAEDAADTFLNAIECLRDPSHVRDRRAAEWVDLLGTAGLEAHVCGTWPLRLEIGSWLERIRTPAEAAAEIRSRLGEAGDEMRETLRIEPDGSFSVPVALVAGRRP